MEKKDDQHGLPSPDSQKKLNKILSMYMLRRFKDDLANSGGEGGQGLIRDILREEDWDGESDDEDENDVENSDEEAEDEDEDSDMEDWDPEFDSDEEEEEEEEAETEN